MEEQGLKIKLTFYSAACQFFKLFAPPPVALIDMATNMIFAALGAALLAVAQNTADSVGWMPSILNIVD